MTHTMTRALALFVALQLLGVVYCEEEKVEYGVDVSFPIQHEKISDNYAWLPHNQDPSLEVPARYKDMPVQPLPGRQEQYDDFLQSCKDAFGSKGNRCVWTERDRVAMSLRQPQSMQNYTALGFKKIKCPENVWKHIKDFWDKNKDNMKKETWGVANTYTNNWVVPTYMVSVEDRSLRGGGYSLKQKIWDAAKTTLSEWTGEELTQCSLYGIRVYKEGAILSTHVDRLPLVSSAIVNVAQDVDEPWPIEVYGHDGKAYNVTMEPGEMVLYESHSVLHGRPFPLKGRFYANIFIHFEPVGHSLRHNAKVEENADVHAKYKEDVKSGYGGHENDNGGLPPYILKGSPEEANWRASHPQGSQQQQQQEQFATGSTLSVHKAAQKGDLAEVKKHVSKSKDAVNLKDSNGWTPLHEASRGGHLDVVKYLIENGADFDSRTNNSRGETPLWWAKRTYGNDHPVVSFLEELGASAIGPEL